MSEDALVGGACAERALEVVPHAAFVEVRAEEPVGDDEDEQRVQPDDADADAAELGEHDVEEKGKEERDRV